MPSSEFIEIDIADNDVAILDASCVVTTSLPAPDEDEGCSIRNSNDHGGKVSQTQESEQAPLVTSAKSLDVEEDDDEDDNNVGQENVQLKSPPPLRKKSNELDATPAAPISSKKRTKKRGSSSAVSTVTPRGRKKASTTSNESPSDKKATMTSGPSTPEKNSIAMSTAAAPAIAVATPGEEDAVGTKTIKGASDEEATGDKEGVIDKSSSAKGSSKKKSKALTSASGSAKPTKTLFSFFGPAKGVAKTANSAKPVAKSVKLTVKLADNVDKSKSKGAEVKKVGKANSEEVTKKSQPAKKSSATEKKDKETSTNDVKTDKTPESAATVKSKKRTASMTPSKKTESNPTSTKKETANNPEQSEKEQMPSSKSTSSKDTTKSISTSKSNPKASKLTKTATPKNEATPLKNKVPINFDESNEESILFSKLENSPVDAVAFASRTMSAGLRRGRRSYYGSGRGSKAISPIASSDSEDKSSKEGSSEEEKSKDQVEEDNSKSEEEMKEVVDMCGNDDNDVEIDHPAEESDDVMIAESTVDEPKEDAEVKVTPKDEVFEEANTPNLLQEDTAQEDVEDTAEDDDATVDLEEIPAGMKAAIESQSDDAMDLDEEDGDEDVPLEIEGEACVMNVDDEITNDSSDVVSAKGNENDDDSSAAVVLKLKEKESKESADDDVEVVNESQQAQQQTEKKTATETKQGKSTTAKITKAKTPVKSKVAPKGISPIAASLKKQAAQSKKQGIVFGSNKSLHNNKGDITEKKDKEVAVMEPATNTHNEKVDEVTTQSKPITLTKESNMEVSAATSDPSLSDDVSSRLQRYLMLREKYVTRAIELASRPSSEDFEEECLSLENMNLARVEVGEDGEFPDGLVPMLLVIVQGSSLPLSTLAKNAMDELSVFTKNAGALTVDSIASKIKLLAQRKQYLSGHPQSITAKANPKIDCFENVDECYMWRWELLVTDLLPSREATKVKRARSSRRKLQSHHKAIINLISSIDKATTWLQNNPTATSSSLSSTPSLAKVSDMEEKVLKYEREEEKARLLLEAKKNKAEEQASKQKNKSLTEEERLAEKKRKDEEKERKKLEAAKEREEAKRKRTEEKENEKQKRRKELEEKEEKQKARMMSFFAKPSATKKQKVTGATVKNSPTTASKGVSSFDSDAFRKMIDSQNDHVSNPFAKMSPRSKLAKRRKTSKVNVSVFVTVLSDNPFAPQPYDEERVITVPNKYKFLGFHEDIRPPYHGTWSKPVSSIVTGRTPFGKDTQYLDYDVDSEAEWEEEDEDQGEDCDADDVDEEDEVVQNEEEENDGWLADDDDLGIEDEDDETREMRKKKIYSESKNPSTQSSHFRAAVISPCFGGTLHRLKEDVSSLVEGMNTHDAMNALSSHMGCVLTPEVTICFDAFPPPENTDNDTAGQNEKNSSTQEISVESLRVISQFIHHSTHNSREKLVTELRKAHPDATSSRAQAMRELDTMAEKKRLPNGGGVFWSVKEEYLNRLGLKEKDLKPSPEVQTESAQNNTKTAPPEKGAVVVSPKPPQNNSPGTKRKQSTSKASANLFAAFLAKKQKTK